MAPTARLNYEWTIISQRIAGAVEGITSRTIVTANHQNARVVTITPPPLIEPTILYGGLSEDEMTRLLDNNGHLFGIHVDGNDGPGWSTCQIAKRKGTAPYPLCTYRETNGMVTEIIPTENDRSSNYVHQGWSKSATSTVTPWIASRIANSNRFERLNDELYITKRITLRRVSVNITLEALSPVPEFEISVADALTKSTKLLKFQALNEIFQFWGDVIALEFDLGTSLSITDRQANFEHSDEGVQSQDLATFKTTRVNTLGGEAKHIINSDASWLNRAVPSHQWSKVRIQRVAPITALLRKETQSQISELYSTLLSYRPAYDGPTEWNENSFDWAPHALKTTSSIQLRTSGYLEALEVMYSDNTRSGKHGGNGSTERVFKLSNGEHITEVMLWADSSWVYATQFVTNYRRVSPHYGGQGGIPTILHSENGVLVGFSGKSKQHPTWKTDFIRQVQTIWRHDVAQTRPDLQNMYFEYFGADTGCPFNDLPFVEYLESACISCIQIRSGNRIDGIQITYSGNFDGLAVNSDAPYHGGQGGGAATFQLERGEHIVTVSGEQKEVISQLCFVTNLDRTSAVYGGGGGTPFICRAPTTSDGTRMRLRYIAGKSAGFLDGLLLVWTRL